MGIVVVCASSAIVSATATAAIVGEENDQHDDKDPKAVIFEKVAQAVHI